MAMTMQLMENEKSHLNSLSCDFSEAVSTGTTLMAVEYDGGVVIGADSRTSSGQLVSSRVTDKITRVSDHIYCGRSGSAADTQAVADIVSSHMEILEIKLGEPPMVKVAANVFKDLLYDYRDQLTAGIIVAGWDKHAGGQVYMLPLGGMLTRQEVAIGGSGSTFIWGYVDANFKPKMTKEECVEFVKNAVTLAISRDGSSGGVVRVGVITEEGIERRLFLHNDLPTFYKG